MKRFVVVGSGLAGHNAALHLRKLLPDASVTLVGEELGTPYDRPPLTKAFLLGRASASDLMLKRAADYAELGVVHRAGTRIAGINRGRAVAVTDEGEEIGYDALLVATGSRPRRMTAGDSSDVHYIRTLADAERLRGRLSAGCRVAVIGGGFVGLEVAASAAALGCAVTVLEAAETLLMRGMPPQLSWFIKDLHESNGVEIRLGASVQHVEADAADGAHVILSDGCIEADVVVAGIGIVPNVELAVAAGLAVDNGILVDANCRTSDPAVYAAGEVTAHPMCGRGPVIRLESWQVAAKQSLVAAACMAGGTQTFDDPPWLWSDQFDVNIQAIGLPHLGERFLFRGNLGSRQWTLVALDMEGLPLGAVAVNNGRDVSMLRRPLRLGEPLPDRLRAGFVPISKCILDQERKLA